MGNNPDSKVHGANMGPTRVLSAPGGPHDGIMNLAIRESLWDVPCGIIVAKTAHKEAPNYILHLSFNKSQEMVMILIYSRKMEPKLFTSEYHKLVAAAF